MPHRRNHVEIKFQAGETIFREGNPGNKLFIIRQGSVMLTKNIDDAELPLTELGPGEVFGEMSLVDERPRSATAVAATDVVCQCISKAMFPSKFKNEVPNWMQSLYLSTVQRLRATTLRTAGGGDLPARQIVELLGNYLLRGKTTYSGATYIPWSEAARKIAYVLDTNPKSVEGIMEILVHSDIANYEVDLNEGKRFLTRSPDSFTLFADYCWDSFMVDRRLLDQKEERLNRKQRQEDAEQLKHILSVLETSSDIHIIGEESLFTQLEGKFGLDRSRYDKLLARLKAQLLIEVDPESGLPGTLKIAIDRCRQEITAVEMNDTFDSLYKSIMQVGTKNPLAVGV